MYVMTQGIAAMLSQEQKVHQQLQKKLQSSVRSASRPSSESSKPQNNKQKIQQEMYQQFLQRIFQPNPLAQSIRHQNRTIVHREQVKRARANSVSQELRRAEKANRERQGRG